MQGYKPGDRVGAILSAEDGVVRFLGYGVYEGDFVPDENAGGLGPLVREEGHLNPKIKLDSGKIVWGCECWWGPEKSVKEKLKLYEEIIEVDMDDHR